MVRWLPICRLYSLWRVQKIRQEGSECRRSNSIHWRYLLRVSLGRIKVTLLISEWSMCRWKKGLIGLPGLRVGIQRRRVGDGVELMLVLRVCFVGRSSPNLQVPA
jgi:hypothetical protein